MGVAEHIGERGLRMQMLGDDETLPANEWQRFETTFTTGPEFRASHVYLYCTNTNARAWFADIELRPTQ